MKINILAEILGFIALALISFSYQKKVKSKFLLLQILANVFYGLQYLVLGAYSAVCMDIISLVRTNTFYSYEEEGKKVPLTVLVLIEIGIALIGVFTFNGKLYSLTPVIIGMVYSIAMWQKDLRITYFTAALTCLAWIYYNFTIGAYVATLASLIELFASVIGFLKITFKNNSRSIEEAEKLIDRYSTNELKSRKFNRYYFNY